MHDAKVSVSRFAIVTLWAVFLLGTLFHTQLGLMPLFHGQSVALGAHGEGNLSLIFWGMLVFFSLPLLAMIGTAMVNNQQFRVFHFGLTLVYTVLNALHLGADLMVRPIFGYQIALMVLLLGVGLLLNREGYCWMKSAQRHRHSLSPAP